MLELIVIGNLIICFPRFEFCSSTPESILNSFPFCNLHNPSDRPELAFSIGNLRIMLQCLPADSDRLLSTLVADIPNY